MKLVAAFTVMTALSPTVMQASSALGNDRVWSIIETGQADDAERKELVTQLQSANERERQIAAQALGKSGVASPEIVTALQQRLDDDSRVVRGAALTALMELGQAGMIRERLNSDAPLAARMEALQALRSNVEGLRDEKLRAQMAVFLKEAAPLVNPPSTAVLKDWTFHQADGGEGSFDAEHLLVKKTNATGEIYLRSARPLKVRRGEKPEARFYFQSSDAPANATMQILFEDKDGNLTLGDPSRGHTAQSQTRVYNTPPEEWGKRFGRLLPAKTDAEYFIQIRFSGEPFSVQLRDIAVPASEWEYLNPASTESLLERKSETRREDKPVTAATQAQNGRARLLVDGRPVPPILYFNQRGELSDYAGMEKLGHVPLMVASVHLTDYIDPRFPSARPVWEKGEAFDFRAPLAQLDHAMQNAPDSWFIINFSVIWPKDWVENHPEEVWRNQEGEKGYGSWLSFLGFAGSLPKGEGMRWWPSPSSRKALVSAEKGIREFTELIKSRPWANRIIGSFISGGHDGQFYTAFYPDHSQPATVAFRAWLRAKYQTDAALQQGWRDSGVTLDTAEVPDYSRLWRQLERFPRLFLDPTREQRFADHHEFQSSQGLRIRERLARSFKEAMGRDVIGMTWQLGSATEQGSEEVFQNSSALDMLVTQPAYQLRQPGFSGGTRDPMASFAKRGKFSVKELDLRTWLRTGGNELTAFRLGAAMNPAMFRSIFRKEAAQMIAAGQGFWLYDIEPIHFRDPEMMEAIAEGVKVYEELELANEKPFQPDVAVVFTGNAASWIAHAMKYPSLLSRLEAYTFSHLKEAGVPFDFLFLTDLLQTERKYKVVVFADAWRLSGAEVNAIRERLQKDHATLIWNYASGYVSDEGLSTAAMSRLTGMRVEAQEMTAYPEARFSKKNALNLAGTPGTGAMAWKIARGLVGADGFRGVPRFHINDAEALPLAEYTDGKTALAMKKFPEWTSVTVGSPGMLDARLLHRLATEAGATVITPPRTVVEFNGRFLSLHALENGEVPLSLPEESVVTDFDTGEIIGEGRVININLTAGSTRWLRVQPVVSNTKPTNQ